MFEVVDGKVQNVEVGESKTNKYDETTGLITMFDALKPGVTIGKQSINGTEELDGAELKLIAPKDADLSKVKASYGDDSVAAIQVKDNTITWTSDAAKGGVTLANLPAGTYTLEEGTAPDGFTRKTETMTFVVGADGKVETVNNLTKKDDKTVVMEDAPSEVSIVKVGKDGDAAQELPGADMKLTYEGNADLSHVTAENGKIEGNAAGSKVITWTSGDKAILLKQIPDGKYTLEETAAPDGYELTTKITEVSRMESELNSLKLSNDEEYSRITSNINLEEIKRIAIGELGMTYATEGQVITYASSSNDYMRQADTSQN